METVPYSMGIFSVPWQFSLSCGNFPCPMGIFPVLWEFLPVPGVSAMDSRMDRYHSAFLYNRYVVLQYLDLTEISFRLQKREIFLLSLFQFLLLLHKKYVPTTARQGAGRVLS